MDANEYQRNALRTDNAGLNPRDRLTMAAMGLAGETGELVDMIKKWVYHAHKLDKAAIKAELGDICWYVAVLADRFDFQLGDVMQDNVDKLRRRYPEGFSEQASREREQ